jgi:Flp pilus assembly pilin Flp
MDFSGSRQAMRQRQWNRQGASGAAVQLSRRVIEMYRAALIKFLLDRNGQDFVEYALMAAFVAASAATISPTMASGAIVMFSRVTSVINLAGS